MVHQSQPLVVDVGMCMCMYIYDIVLIRTYMYLYNVLTHNHCYVHTGTKHTSFYSYKCTLVIQQNDRLDQTPAKLFPSEILGDVPQRSTILVPPPSQARL